MISNYISKQKLIFKLIHTKYGKLGVSAFIAIRLAIAYAISITIAPYLGLLLNGFISF